MTRYDDLLALTASDPAAALARLDAGDVDDPYQASYLRARAYAAQGRVHRMVTSLRTAFDHDRDQRDAVTDEAWLAPWRRDPRVILMFAAADDLGLAFDAMMEGNLDEAGDLLAEPDGMSDPPTAWMLRTMLHLQTGDAEEARGFAERVVAAVPSMPEGWFNLAAARAACADSDGAIAAYRRAVEVEPEHANSWFNLGNATRQTGDRDASRDAFARAADLEPRRPLFWYKLAEAEALRGDAAATEAAIHRAGAIDPGVYEAILDSDLIIDALGFERTSSLADAAR